MLFEETDDEQVQDNDYPKPLFFCLCQKSNPWDHKTEILIFPWANSELAYVAYLFSVRAKKQGFRGTFCCEFHRLFFKKIYFYQIKLKELKKNTVFKKLTS